VTRAEDPGDPYDTSVLLWTRAVPIGTYRVDVPMCVEYKVYSGANATGEAVTSGWALTNADVDFTVTVRLHLAGGDGSSLCHHSPLGTSCTNLAWDYPAHSSPTEAIRAIAGARLRSSLALTRCQVEAEGLKAGTQYSFQFSNCADGNNKSPIGKTRTAPGWKATNIPTQRFGVYSSSNYPK
jgi:phosphodiesterase/alkaline phosphatase D-like protein